MELVGLLARRGANVSDHEKELKSVFGEYNADKILQDDALIGRLSQIVTLDVAKESGHDEGVKYKFTLLFNRVILCSFTAFVSKIISCLYSDTPLFRRIPSEGHTTIILV